LFSLSLSVSLVGVHVMAGAVEYLGNYDDEDWAEEDSNALSQVSPPLPAL
jgi:hypothetical protein